MPTINPWYQRLVLYVYRPKKKTHYRRGTLVPEFSLSNPTNFESAIRCRPSTVFGLSVCQQRQC